MLKWKKEFSALCVFHFLLVYQCDDAENGGSGYGSGNDCVGWGEANYCIAIVKSGLGIFTSPWQEANLSCGPCSKGTKNCSEKCNS